MIRKISHTLAFGVFLAASASALADAPASAWQDIAAGDTAKALAQAWPLAADGRIDVGNISGKVQVSGWNQAQVRLEGTLGAGSTLVVTGNARSLNLRVKATKTGWFGSDSPTHGSTLILHVPKDAALDLNVVSADANVDGMAGPTLKVGSVSGDVALSSAAPQIDVDSVSGNVTVTAAGTAAGKTHVQTVSGDVHAKDLGGRIKLETVSGTMHCACASVTELETGSVSGDADVAVAPARDARVHMSSMSGNLRLSIPAATSARIDASSFSGDIRSDFGQPQEKSHGPGSSLKATIGGGDAQIQIESLSGDVRLSKQ